MSSLKNKLSRTFRKAVLFGFGVSMASCAYEPKSRDTILRTGAVVIDAPAMWTDWRDRQNAQMKEDNKVVNRYTKWIAKFEGKENLPLLSKIKLAQRTVNAAITYQEDSIRYKKRDYYATAVESLGVSSPVGDCEDYVIAKYDALVRMGVPEERMFMLLVAFPESKNILEHAVLAVDTSAKLNRRNCVILDNNKPTLVETLGDSRLYPYYVVSPRDGVHVVTIETDNTAQPVPYRKPEYVITRK